MADRSNVWAAMYGAVEEQDNAEPNSRPTQHRKQAATNQRRFLSAQPPFASDGEELEFSRTKHSHKDSVASLTEKTSHDMSHGHTQRYREIFGSAMDGTDVELPAKRKKPSSHSIAVTRHLYPSSANTPFDHEPATSTAANTNNVKDYGGADLSADMADVTEFAFWNDVQRCETLLGALKDNLEICKEKMDTYVVAKMAGELERVVGALNERL